MRQLNFPFLILIQGYGEGVCYIVNDLTNRELIRKKFKFETFKMIDEGENMDSGAPSDEENPNDEMFASFNLMNISKQDWNK